MVAEAAVAAAGRPAPQAVPYAHAALPHEFREWVEGFLADPTGAHQLGTPVCPALPSALDRGTILVGCLQIPDSSEESLTISLADALQRSMAHLRSPEGHSLHAVLWTADGLPAFAFRSSLENAFNRVREIAVDLGVMSGCFHPYRIRRSRVAPGVQTMTSPIPAVAFRQLLVTDRESFDGEPNCATKFDSWLSSHDQDEATQELSRQALAELAQITQPEEGSRQLNRPRGYASGETTP